MKKLMAIVMACLCLLLCACADHADRAAYTEQTCPLERNGVALHLSCMTANGVEQKDNILLVHGLTYSSHEFDVDYEDYSLVRFLCDHGYAVWRIDITGYGQSGLPDDGFTPDSVYASEDVQAAIAEILRLTDTETIDLLGWSWGTVTSALAEAQCADVIDKYVMYAPILTGLGEAEITDAYHENNWLHAASDFQVNEDGTINEEITERAVVDTYCSNCWRYDGLSSPNGGRRDLCVDSSIALIDLSKIKDPTLVICGDQDPYMNLPQVEACLSSLPENSQLQIIPGGSHCIMIEKPYYHEFRKKLLAFLES